MSLKTEIDETLTVDNRGEKGSLQAFVPNNFSVKKNIEKLYAIGDSQQIFISKIEPWDLIYVRGRAWGKTLI